MIGGVEVDGTSTMSAVSPRDGSVLAEVAMAGEHDVDAAVGAARWAFDEGPWPRMTPKERKVALLRFAELLHGHRDELALLVSLEMGKPIADSLGIEVRALVNCFRWYAELADKVLDESPQAGEDVLALVTREPAGVVGAVVPWNFPLTMAAWKLAPALAVGCTVVLKPAEQSPLSALRLGQLALEAGLPDGVLNVITGDGPTTGRALGLHAGVDVLSFTGSGEVGRMFLRYAADSNLKRVWLELGGKSPNIILPDAPDLALAAKTSAWGIFFNQGEMCTAPSRLIVHRDVAEPVTSAIEQRARALVVGDPLDPETEMGPLVTAEQLERVRGYVDGAPAEGSTLRVGGVPPAVDGALVNGFWLSPTVFGDVPLGSRLAREEVFGPVLATIVVDDLNQALRIANDTDYGLAAAIWTSNLSTAHRLARRLRAGTVWVNCYEEGDMSVPFGGVKGSGFGRDKSIHALEKYTDLKTTWIQL